MDFSCPYCKGSRLEHLRNCPKVYSIISQQQFNTQAKKDYFGEAPNIFVGRFGYPKVNVGILSSEDVKEDHDAPKLWANENYDIPKIVNLRSSLINSKFTAHVKTFDEKLLDVTQEVSMARKAVDVEINLDRKPIFDIRYNDDITPFGPTVNLKKAEVTENVSVAPEVDKVVSDTDLNATSAMKYLYGKGHDEHSITKLLSAGTLGVKEQRKLVPTRWSITASDDTLGKMMIKDLRDLPHADYMLHFGSYLGNNYIILVFPSSWSYELFETYIGNTSDPDPSKFETASDYEGAYGRKDYAANTVGGYYACRLAVLERLKAMKRQASVLALRFITDEYWMPLGVWVVREASRNAVSSKPIGFGSKEMMLTYAKELARRKFGFDLQTLFDRSVLLRELRTQKRLFEF